MAGVFGRQSGGARSGSSLLPAAVFRPGSKLIHPFNPELGVGLVMLAMAVVMGGIQGGAMKRLADRFRERRLILVGLGLMALAFISVPIPQSVAFLLVPLTIAAGGRGARRRADGARRLYQRWHGVQ